MKTAQLIVLILSAIYCFGYISIINSNYPKQKDISSYVKFFSGTPKMLLTGGFLLSIILPFLLIIYTPVAWGISVFLSGIFVYTGYNPNIKNDKREDVIHVVLTTSAIVFAMFYYCILNIWLLIAVVLFAIYYAYAEITKIERRTFKVEVFGIIVGYICNFVLIFTL